MIKRLIVHQVIKEAHTKEADLIQRSDVLPVGEDLAQNLFKQLQSSFRSHNPTVGKFRTVGASQSRFKQILSDFLAGYQNDEAFVKMTQYEMSLLKAEMVKQPLSTGGYTVYVHYTANGSDYLLVSMLSVKAQPTFDEDLNLIAAITPNLTNLRHAARIRLGGVEENGDGVVQFISQRASKISDYFVEFLGCEEIVRSETQGRILYSLVDAWCRDNSYDDDKKGGLKAKVFEYWQTCRKEKQPMTLQAVANILEPEDSEPVLTHLTAEGSNLAGDFSPPPPYVMKRFVRFSFDGEGFKLEFDRNRWENNIMVSKDSKTLTIKNVPQELIDQMSNENE